MEMINKTGRRKASVARVYLKRGDGNITNNGKDYKEYFPQQHIQNNIVAPFQTLDELPSEGLGSQQVLLCLNASSRSWSMGVISLSGWQISSIAAFWWCC